MFTGIVSHVAEIIRVGDSAAGRELAFRSPWTDVQLGESIALNGVCLTVTSFANGECAFAAVGTTLDRTTLGAWGVGSRVNIERALRAGDRLGGHLVQGHVDGVADVASVTDAKQALLIDFSLWEGAESASIPQGSVTVDGVSLTVLAVPSPRTLSVSIIDHTRRHTTLGALKAGDRVNIELDVIGKYVRQLVAPWSALTGAT